MFLTRLHLLDLRKTILTMAANLNQNRVVIDIYGKDEKPQSSNRQHGGPAVHNRDENRILVDLWNTPDEASQAINAIKGLTSKGKSIDYGRAPIIEKYATSKDPLSRFKPSTAKSKSPSSKLAGLSSKLGEVRGKSRAQLEHIREQLASTRGATVLVFYFNGFELGGALVYQQQKSIQIKLYAGSSLADPLLALEEVIGKLKAVAGKLPKRATLVDAGVFTALMPLPVDADTPRPENQMLELVRYEVGSAATDNEALWRIGAIMQGRGLITTAQRRELVIEQEVQTGQDEDDAPQFGELAIEQGLISEEQLEQCLSLQEYHRTPVGRPGCGWVAQLPRIDPDLIGQDDLLALSGKNWLLSSTGSVLRKRWVMAMTRHKIALTGIVSPIGCSLYSISETTEEQIFSLVLEVHQEQLACFALMGLAISDMQVEPRSEGSELVERLAGVAREYLRPEIRQVQLYSSTVITDDQIRCLSEQLQREIVVIPAVNVADGVKAPTSMLQPLIGAAGDQLRARKGQHYLATVAPNDPKPSVFRDIESLKLMIPVGLLVLAIAHSGWLFFKTENTKIELTHLNEEYSRRSAEQKRLQTMNAELKARRGGELVLRKQLQKRREQLEVANTVLLVRSKALPLLLNAIVSPVTHDMVIDSIVELDPEKGGGFQITGWGARDTTVHRYAKKLSEDLPPHGYQVGKGLIVQQRAGRSGVPGYGIDIRLTVQASTDELSGDPISDQSNKAKR